MRRWFVCFTATLLVALLLATTSTPAVAGTRSTAQYPSPKVLLNGNPVTSDVPAIIKDGRTYLPLRAIAEALGGQVGWDDATRTAIITKDGKQIRMTIDVPAYVIDGKSVPMEAAPFIFGGRTVVPVRYLAEALGQFVEWDQASFTVSLSSGDRGNTTGNVANWGKAAAQGEWIYFGNFDFKLYKIRFDGTGLTKLSDSGASQINVLGNWIYFTGGDALRRVRTDGSGETIISNGVFSWVQVVGDWIYYSDRWQKGLGTFGGPLYKIKTDGSEKVRLSEWGTQQINVVGDGVYFYATPSSGATYLNVPVDGGNETDLKVPHTGIQLIVQDGYMYYWWPHWSGGREAGGTFYRNSLDGTHEEVIWDTGVANGALGFYQIDDGWLYYTVGSRDGGILYRHKIGSDEAQALTSEPVAWLNEVGDYFFCQNSFDGDTYYLLSKDGSEKIILNHQEKAAEIAQ